MTRSRIRGCSTIFSAANPSSRTRKSSVRPIPHTNCPTGATKSTRWRRSSSPHSGAKRRRTSSSTGRPGPAKPQARNSSARNSRAPRRSTASRVTSSTSTARSPIRSIAYSHNSRTSSSKRTKSGSTNALRNSNRCSRPSTSTMPIWRPANVRRPKRPSRPIWQTIRRRPIRSISFLTTRKNRLLTIHLETIVAPSRSILHPKGGLRIPPIVRVPPTALI